MAEQANKRIKVLFLINTLLEGGAERVLVNLVNRIDRDKYDVTVQLLFRRGSLIGLLEPEVKLYVAKQNFFMKHPRLLKLFKPSSVYKMYVQESYDVVISYLEGLPTRIISGAPDTAKKIAWIHVEQGTKKAASAAFKSYDEAVGCYKRMNKIVCVSSTVRDDFLRLFPGLAGQMPVVVYNTIDVDKVRAGMDETVDDIKLNNNEFNIAVVARLDKETKGYDRLLNITKRLADEGYPVHVYALGKGSDADVLLGLRDEYRIRDHFTFLGFKDNPYKYVKSCDLYVCSSRREGFSTAVTEALIVGTPVVSTRCSGAVELLGENGEYGIVTDNDEEALYKGIKRMLTEDGLLSEYARRSAARGAMFNTFEAVKSAEAVIDEVYGA